MYNLRIELSPKVFYNQPLGKSYLKVADLESCDPDIVLGQSFHNELASIWQSGQDFVPNVVLFKGGKPDLNEYIDFESIFYGFNIPDKFRCWIMNDTGDTIETFIVKNILEKDEYDS